MGVDEKRRVLSIAIDETVTAAIGVVSPRGVEEVAPLRLAEEKVRGNFGPQYVMARFGEIDKALIEHGATYADRQIDYLVISTIGLVDTIGLVVRAIARPGWPELDEPLNFNHLLTSPELTVLREIAKSGSVCMINDASAVAVAEYEFGAGADIARRENAAFAVVRLGEGLNAGLLVGGRVWRGGLHPEFGHMIPTHKQDEDLPGVECPYHAKRCFEAIISEQAILKRWNIRTIKKAQENSEIRKWLAEYVTELCVSITLLLAPERIVLAGKTPDAKLRRLVSDLVRTRLNGYPDYAALRDRQRFIGLASIKRYANNLGGIEIGRKMVLSVNG